jgi:hypothetical protein
MKYFPITGNAEDSSGSTHLLREIRNKHGDGFITHNLHIIALTKMHDGRKLFGS